MERRISAVYNNLEFIHKTKLMIYKYNMDNDRNVNYLKPKQFTAIRESLQGDLMVTLPTGFGKSLIYHLLPYATDNKTSAVIIVSPLNSIIEEQAAMLKASFVVNEGWQSNSLYRDVKNGSIKYIFGHPEVLVSHEFKNCIVGLNISHVFVDEAHCVLKWGKSQFRPCYMQLASLKCFLNGPNFVAMTATATLDDQVEIKQVLNMNGTRHVHASPNRKNVFLSARQRPPVTGGSNDAESSFRAIMDPILEELNTLRQAFPKTIVYMPLVWCGRAHRLACITLGLELTVPDEVVNGELNSLVAQYHAPQGQKMKSLITTSMKTPNSTLRLLFATEAYGMGTDAPDIKRVVHFGPPASLESLVQHFGRAGRDGREAESIVHYNATDLAASHVSAGMKSYCRFQSCRREFIEKYFGAEELAMDFLGNNCCDNCSK